MRLYLAPHHDDVHLSLPVRMRGEEKAQVLVVFSEESETMHTISALEHTRLGVTVHSLGLPESSRRGLSLRESLRPQRTLQSLLSDPLLFTTIIAIESILPIFCANICLVVPALPVHIDHALSRLAAQALLRDGRVQALALYADQPYASLWPHRLAAQIGPPLPPEPIPDAPLGEIEGALRAWVPLISEVDVRRILKNAPSRLGPELLYALPEPPLAAGRPDGVHP